MAESNLGTIALAPRHGPTFVLTLKQPPAADVRKYRGKGIVRTRKEGRGIYSSGRRWNFFGEELGIKKEIFSENLRDRSMKKDLWSVEKLRCIESSSIVRSN